MFATVQYIAQGIRDRFADHSDDVTVSTYQGDFDLANIGNILSRGHITVNVRHVGAVPAEPIYNVYTFRQSINIDCYIQALSTDSRVDATATDNLLLFANDITNWLSTSPIPIDTDIANLRRPSLIHSYDVVVSEIIEWPDNNAWAINISFAVVSETSGKLWAPHRPADPVPLPTPPSAQPVITDVTLTTRHSGGSN